jgi:predicted acylesterase/phospholipase RssA
MTPAADSSPPRSLELKWERDYARVARLLDAVDATVSHFRPSPSLADVAGSGNLPRPVVDLVISGGGLKGYSMVGATLLLRRHLERRGIDLGRVSGTSCGAWCAFFLVSGVSTRVWLKSYQLSRWAHMRRPGEPLHNIYRDVVWPWLQHELPADAYKKCSGGKCVISITRFDGSFCTPRNWTVSEFASNDDLFNACLASSSIPFVTEPGLGRTFRGHRVVDGGLTRNTPIFTDGKSQRQLIVRLSNVQYPWRLLTTPNDRCVEAFVLRGAILMSKFLEGVESEEEDALVWVERAEKEHLETIERARRTSRRRLLLVVAGLGGVAFWRVVPVWLGLLLGRRNNVIRAVAGQVPIIGKLAASLGGGLTWTGAVGFSSLVGLMQVMGLLL